MWFLIKITKETITDADYADDLALYANTPTKPNPKFLVWNKH